MIPNKLMTILVAGLLIGASGCSGTRLRNLITRSDYMSMEELEAQDAAAETAVAESAESESSEKLVSSEQESSEDDEKSGDEKKKSWFSFAALLGRSSDDSELSPDPFVDVEETETDTEKTVAAEANDDSESAETKTVAAEATERYSATMTTIEDQAEGMFDKLAAAEAEKSVKERIKLPEIMPTTELSESGQQSFADFIANRDGTDTESAPNEVRSTLTKVIADAGQGNPFAAEPAIAAARNATELSNFDRLMNQNSNAANELSSETPVKDAFSSKLFPELDQLMTNGNVGPAADGQGLDLNASPEATIQNPPQPHLETLAATEDPFQVASRKHGFDDVQRQDPWAAFTRQDGNAAQNISDVAPQESTEPDGFVWRHQSQTPQSEALAVNETVLENFETPAPPPVFQQVSTSDRPARVTGGAQLSTDFSAGLTIPTPPAPQPLPSNDFEQFAATTTEQVPRTEAPLDFAEPAGTDFEDAFDATLIGASPEARTGSSVIVADGWPMRTWIFLIGFAVVAYLLFAPARQNRPKA
jgi:hypothetical protein